MVGPEGGFSELELSQLEKAGFQRVSLGDTILRTETAALYALAAVTTILREESTWVLQNCKE